MKYICSWCRRPIRETEEPPTDKISHTICDQCAKKLLEGGFEDGKFTFQVSDERATA